MGTYVSDGAHVEGTSNGTGNGSLLVGLVLDALANVVDATTIGELDHHGGVGLLGGLEARVGHGGHGAVHRGDGVLVLLGMVQEGEEVLSGDDARLEGL